MAEPPSPSSSTECCVGQRSDDEGHRCPGSAGDTAASQRRGRSLRPRHTGAATSEVSRSLRVSRRAPRLQARFLGNLLCGSPARHSSDAAAYQPKALGVCWRSCWTAGACTPPGVGSCLVAVSCSPACAKRECCSATLTIFLVLRSRVRQLCSALSSCSSSFWAFAAGYRALRRHGVVAVVDLDDR